MHHKGRQQPSCRALAGTRAAGRLTSGSTLRFEFRSDLLPASAMTMFGLPCRCSSFTHCLARWNESCGDASTKVGSGGARQRTLAEVEAATEPRDVARA